MGNLLMRAYFLLKDDSGDAKFDSSLQIVISFIIGAIILAFLVAVFGTTIEAWLNTTVASWFGATGIPRPSYST